MILIEKWTGREVNVSELEGKLAMALKEIKDERLVKPKQFKISEIDKDGTMNGIFVHGSENIDERVESYNGKILWSKIKYAEGERAGYDAFFKAIVPEIEELVHQSPIYYVTNNCTVYTDMVDLFVKNKVVGDPNFTMKNRMLGINGAPTYLKARGTNERDFLGGGNEFYVKDQLEKGIVKSCYAFWSFDVSVPELLNMRTMFYDPEGVDTEHEFKRTFMIFGGIPFQAITKAKINLL